MRFVCSLVKQCAVLERKGAISVRGITWVKWEQKSPFDSLLYEQFFGRKITKIG